MSIDSVGNFFSGIAPDGRHVATHDGDRLLVWDIDIARWSELACSRAGRTLTEAEWEEFLGDEPYDPFCT